MERQERVKLIPIQFEKIMQMRAYTVILLSALEKEIAIYTEPSVGKLIQGYLTESERPRPLTHDLIQMMLIGFEIEIMKVVIYDLRDTVYHAKLFLIRPEEGRPDTILELDARPSDAISLAIMRQSPIFCTQQVLDHAFPYQEEGKEEQTG